MEFINIIENRQVENINNDFTSSNQLSAIMTHNIIDASITYMGFRNENTRRNNEGGLFINL